MITTKIQSDICFFSSITGYSQIMAKYSTVHTFLGNIMIKIKLHTGGIDSTYGASFNLLCLRYRA